MLDFKALRNRMSGDADSLLDEGDASSGPSAGLLIATGFAAGVGAGLLLGLLIAPRSGSETRQALRHQFQSEEGDLGADEVDRVLGVG